MNADTFYPGSYLDDDGKRVYYGSPSWSLEAYKNSSGDTAATEESIAASYQKAARDRGR